MYHIVNNTIRGYVHFNKCGIGDITELIRVQPNAARMYLTMTQFADQDNELITDLKTLSEILMITVNDTAKTLGFLIDNGFINTIKVRVKDKEKIKYRALNQDLYIHAKALIWRELDKKFVYNYKKENAFIKIKINVGLVQCSNNRRLNILVSSKRNKMYDRRNDEDTSTTKRSI